MSSIKLFLPALKLRSYLPFSDSFCHPRQWVLPYYLLYRNALQQHSVIKRLSLDMSSPYKSCPLISISIVIRNSWSNNCDKIIRFARWSWFPTISCNKPTFTIWETRNNPHSTICKSPSRCFSKAHSTSHLLWGRKSQDSSFRWETAPSFSRIPGWVYTTIR